MAQQWEDGPVRDPAIRGWLAGRARAYAAFTLGALAFATIGGSALIGASAQGEGTPKQGHAVVNHGRCVSRAAHAAKDAGLTGAARGAFMRAVAHDQSLTAAKDDDGGSCDFAEALADALAEQAGAGSEELEGPGRSAEAKAAAAQRRAEKAQVRAAKRAARADAKAANRAPR